MADLQLELEVERFVSSATPTLPKPIPSARTSVEQQNKAREAHEPHSIESTSSSISSSLSASSPSNDRSLSNSGCSSSSSHADSPSASPEHSLAHRPSTPTTLDPFSEHLPHELFLRVLRELGPVVSLRVAALVCHTWRDFALDNANWTLFFQQRFGPLTPPLATTFVQSQSGRRWLEAYRVRMFVERRFQAQPLRLQIMRDDNPQVIARKAVERAEYIEHLINLQRAQQAPPRVELKARHTRDLLHSFVYHEYTRARENGMARESGMDWVDRNMARRLCTHAQELRRAKRAGDAQPLLLRCVDICTYLNDKAKKAAAEAAERRSHASLFIAAPPPPAQANQQQPQPPQAQNNLPAHLDGLSQKNYLGVAVIWSTALTNLALIELELRQNRARADELFLAAQKMLLHLRDNDSYKSFNLACIFALCGQPNECRKWLEEAFEQGNMTMHWFSDESDFDAVREQRWFSALLAKVAERDRERLQREAEAQKTSDRCSVM